MLIPWFRGHASSRLLQQVLIPELPQLHQVRPQAVDLLVHLHVSQRFTPQLLLQLLLAAVDLLHPRLQLIGSALDPRRRAGRRPVRLVWCNWRLVGTRTFGMPTCRSLRCCLMWGTCRYIPCCSVPEFHTPPQRFEWFHWKPLWLCVCSAGPREDGEKSISPVCAASRLGNRRCTRGKWRTCDVWLNVSYRRSYSLLFSLYWSCNILSCCPTASMSISVTTCCDGNRYLKSSEWTQRRRALPAGFLRRWSREFSFDGVSSPVGVSTQGTTAVCPVWHCTGPETCSGNTEWGAPRRWRPAARWSQPSLLCWRSWSVCWKHLSCRCGNRTDTKLQMNSRITLLTRDRLWCCDSGQLPRSYCMWLLQPLLKYS